ncbi:MAG: pilus assembly protein TadG-related protein, partial [Methylobacter sp.]
SKKQRGVVVVVVTIALPVLLLIMGLALDFGHVFVNKTRLQNALDATALSAAIAINKNIKNGTGPATDAGKATFNKFIAGSGNDELAGLAANNLVFDYSRTLNPWGTFDPVTDKFAYVRVTSTGMLNVTPVLIKVTNRFTDDIPIPAIATAGPVGNSCELVPLVICPQEGAPTGCDENGCNGIPFHTKVCLKGGTAAAKEGTCQDPSLPTGNFGLLRFDGFAGGADIRELLAGTVNTCTNNPTWENGNKVGPVTQGIEDRFEADLVQTEYQGEFPNGGYHPQYIADTNAQLAKTPVPAGTANKRVMAVPVVENCSASPVNIVAASCFLMTEVPTHTGTANEIIGELTAACPGPGAFDPTNPVLFGPYKIVLFKSPGSVDS